MIRVKRKANKKIIVSLFLLAAFVILLTSTILMNIFGDRGQAYVVDLGGMAIKVVFNFAMSPYEKAIIQSGVFPHPGGVELTMQYINKQIFGFHGSQLQPFNQAPFLGEKS